jgi:hypothetical protein
MCKTEFSVSTTRPINNIAYMESYYVQNPCTSLDLSNIWLGVLKFTILMLNYSMILVGYQ